jgi:hypothetical protein
MLVLVLGVLTTINLGHGVHERIRLQNTADSAAYSTAALEARAFNFYAYANRTQISHYVSAMIWQSQLSFLYWGEAFLTDVYGMLKTFNPCVHPSEWLRPVCAAARAAPYVGSILAVVSTLIEVYRSVLIVYQRALRISHADELIGKEIIPAHLLLNRAMSGISAATAIASLADIQSGGNRIARENDPDIQPGSFSTVFGALNSCLFYRAHYRETADPLPRFFSRSSSLDPSATGRIDRVARAKRVMAQAANASRYGCDASGGSCPESFVTSRKLDDLAAASGWLAPLRAVSIAVEKYGQTRLMTFDSERQLGVSKNRIRIEQDTPQVPSGKLAQGDVLAADDLYRFNVLATWGDHRLGRGRREQDFVRALTTSIWAMSEKQARGGIHWRVSYPGYPQGEGQVDPRGNEAEMGVTSEGSILGVLGIYRANVRGIHDGNHPWEGIAPFPHFEAGKFMSNCLSPAAAAADLREASSADDFNQPSVWVSFHKGAGDMLNRNDASGAGSNQPALLNAAGTLKSTLGSERLVMSASRVSFPGFPAGINAIARAQVYYHRPGNWREQPNFFNPYWRPRLAAIYPPRQIATIGPLDSIMAGPLGQLLPRILTH